MRKSDIIRYTLSLMAIIGSAAFFVLMSVSDGSAIYFTLKLIALSIMAVGAMGSILRIMVDNLAVEITARIDEDYMTIERVFDEGIDRVIASLDRVEAIYPSLFEKKVVVERIKDEP